MSSKPDTTPESSGPHEQQHEWQNSPTDKKAHDEAPKIKKHNELNSADKSRRNSAYGYYSPRSLSMAKSRENIASNGMDDTNVPNVEYPRPAEPKMKRGPYLLKKTLSSLSMTSVNSNHDDNRDHGYTLNSSKTHNYPSSHGHHDPQHDHHHVQFFPNRKQSFAESLFKRFAGSNSHESSKAAKENKAANLSLSTANPAPVNRKPSKDLAVSNHLADNVPNALRRKVSSLVRGSSVHDVNSNAEKQNRPKVVSQPENTLHSSDVPNSKRSHRKSFLLSSTSPSSSRRGSNVSSMTNSDNASMATSGSHALHHNTSNVSPTTKSKESVNSESADRTNSNKAAPRPNENIPENPNFEDKRDAVTPTIENPIACKPSLFRLDTNLEDVTDITKTVPPTAVNSTINSTHGTETASPKTVAMPQGPRKSVSMADIAVATAAPIAEFTSTSNDKSQWVAPQSWDVETKRKKPKTKGRSKSRRTSIDADALDPMSPAPLSKKDSRYHKSRHHRHHRGRKDNESTVTAEDSNSSFVDVSKENIPNQGRPAADPKSVNRLRSNLTMSPPSIRYAPSNLDGDYDTSSTSSSLTSSSITSEDTSSCSDSSSYTNAYMEANREQDTKTLTLNKTKSYTKKFTSSSVNMNSPDGGQSNSGLLLQDEKDDEVECQLEHYYKDFSDLDPKRHYAIRIFNTDDTFTTLSCTPATTVEEVIPALKRKFNITAQGNFQISLKVGKLSKILRPTSKPILIERKLLLLNGYGKSDPLHIMGIEDLSFVFKFLFHPVTPSHFTPEQEQRIMRSEFVHVDLRNMDLTTPPIIFYQHTSEIESLDVSNNANIFLPLEFIESSIKLLSLRMVNIRASKFPSNITEAYKLVSLELQRNFIRKVPNSIMKLNNLTILNLQCNELENLPAGFVELKNLQLLDLSSNKFMHYPEVINHCTNLLQIDLSYNKIQSLPQSSKQLVKLAKMNLSHNKLNFIGDLSEMTNLRTLNLRYNRISSIKTNAYSLQNLFLTDNRISNFDDTLPKLRALEIQENPITSISFKDFYPKNMTSLTLNKAQLSSIPGELLTKLSFLEKLELNQNNLTRIPEEISTLTKLVFFSVARNKLEYIPPELSQLKSLRTLDLHSNNIRDFVDGMENLELTSLNISSNAFGNSSLENSFYHNMSYGSKLSKSLMFFIAADNQFDDAMWPLFNCFVNLKVLNLSYNNFSDVSHMKLESITELYLSGNKLTTLSGDTVLKWSCLKTLMLNSNQMLSLPAELSNLSQLSVFDVGANQLKYNISNYHYDWNWKNNKELKYLNFSGNRRFEIKSFISHDIDADLSDLTVLPQLKVLGLMDVTLNTTKVPDESVNFRLRTTASIINGMRYGVADTLGQRDYVSSRDVTFERFRGNDDECLLCLHDSKNQNADYGHNISRIVRDIYDKILIRQLERYGDDTDDHIKTALRFSFLQLNKEINGMLNSVDNGADVANLSYADLLSGACSTVIYIRGKRLFATNLGDCMAILSKNNGDYLTLTKQHLPTRREEYERIRISGGYVNNGKLDGVVDVSRAVGFFDLLPHIHASPDISVVTLTKADEMLIVATHKLWEYMDVDTVCDIARENSTDPLRAAAELKDHAMAYGCTENITILCLALYENVQQQNRFTLNKNSLMTRRSTFEDTTLRRLQPEISPPTGNLAMVFTDIKSSTFLWELFPNAMRTAIKTHNDIMRRQLRIYGGYEVKTEGDAFMVAFPTPTSGLTWCLSVQLKLLDAQWPEEITSVQDGCQVTDRNGNIIYQGLSVRMGIHWGCPVPELDLVTQRMDYLGPMVNKAARVQGVADGGQIAMSSDFYSEFNKIMKFHERVVKGKESLKEVYCEEIIGEVLEREIAMLESIGWAFFDFGEHKLKGLETKELVTIAYPKILASRHEFASEDEQSKLINETMLFRLRVVSNRLESVMSALSGGFIELDSRTEGSYIKFNPKVENGIMQSISEKDALLFFDHVITRIESSVALLHLRQQRSSGLEICRNDRSSTQSNIFNIVDELLEMFKETKDLSA
ncbi:adenylate cyclase SKDI_10G2030 [Saccharomyces kudriavzevii IFO 1802]|uniref:Adenylate cyclase n=5 Tax=Saccharomyces TaxID=4930 RepID=A0AA35IZU9_SACK1|nr:uncharacterized protein SKDI_10G2030 [Saccharomyces kudriavzevii IFO 1802]CAI4043792.1 hypothetical protein SKDI_10G2030 [Saccharomyces kudriavzevii IFO 1802]